MYKSKDIANILISIPYSLCTPLLVESYGLCPMAFHKILKGTCVDYIFLIAEIAFKKYLWH